MAGSEYGDACGLGCAGGLVCCELTYPCDDVVTAGEDPAGDGNAAEATTPSWVCCLSLSTTIVVVCTPSVEMTTGGVNNGDDVASTTDGGDVSAS